MSYYKLKYASINKKSEEITLTVAASNVSPVYYFKSPYKSEERTFRENVEDFVVSMLKGNIQGGQSKIRSLMSFLNNTIKWQCKETSYEMDFKYKVSRVDGLYHILAKEIGVPTLLNENWASHQSEVDALIAEYEAESKRIYEEKQKEFDEAGIIPISSASSSSVFPGLIVLAPRGDMKNLHVVSGAAAYPNNDYLIICEKACYERNGLCETKAGKCVIVNDKAGLYHVLSYGTAQDVSYDDSIFNEIRKITDTVGRLPYPSFEPEKYGFKMKEVA